MHRTGFILAFLLLGCNEHGGETAATTRPTTTAGSRPILDAVELRYGIHLLRLETRISVSPDGLLRSVETFNKSYGGNDIDPKHERVEIREGRLTAEQIVGLSRLFAGWDSLSSEPYGAVPDDPTVEVRYVDKAVSGGSEVPKQVNDVRVQLSELAKSMPVVKP